MGITPINKFSTKSAENYLSLKYSIIRRDILNNLIYLQQKTTRKQYIMKQITTNDEPSQLELNQLIKYKLNLEQPYYTTKLQDTLSEDAHEYCSYKYKVYLIFQGLEKDLKIDLLQRKMKGVMYQEQELIEMMVCIMKALKGLKQIGHKHQAVCSKNIFLDNSKGKVKLLDPWLKTSNLQELPSYHIYSSPEKLEVGNGTDTGYDWYLSDLFSLGVMGLEMYYLEFMNELYEGKSLKREMMERKIEGVRYGKFRQLVKGLTGPLRLRYQTVSDFCSEYSRKIHVSPSPPKVTHQVVISPRHSPRGNNQHRSPFTRHSSPIHRQLQYHPFHSYLNRTTSITKLHNNTPRKSPPPERKFGPRINIPVLMRHNNTRVMSFQVEGKSQVMSHHGSFDDFERDRLNQKLLKENKKEVERENLKKEGVWEKKFGRISSGSQLSFDQILGGDNGKANNNPELYNHLKGRFSNDNEMKNLFEQKEYKYSDQLTKFNKNNNTVHQEINSTSNNIFLNNNQINHPSPKQVSKTLNPPLFAHPSHNNHHKKLQIKPSSLVPNLQNRTKTIPQVTQNSTLSFDEQLDLQFQALKAYAQTQVLSSSPNQITYSNGSYYQGSLSNNTKQGYGKLFSPNNLVVYQGHWHNDTYHGFGHLTNPSISTLPDTFSFKNLSNINASWTSYQGQFHLGRKNGPGKLTLSNQDTFQGSFLNDRIHGNGTYKKKNGTTIQGYWNNGYFIE